MRDNSLRAGGSQKPRVSVSGGASGRHIVVESGEPVQGQVGAPHTANWIGGASKNAANRDPVYKQNSLES
jgi:hypothetical protein